MKKKTEKQYDLEVEEVFCCPFCGERNKYEYLAEEKLSKREDEKIICNFCRETIELYL